MLVDTSGIQQGLRQADQLGIVRQAKRQETQFPSHSVSCTLNFPIYSLNIWVYWQRTPWQPEGGDG
jgi:hypothetical protein